MPDVAKEKKNKTPVEKPFYRAIKRVIDLFVSMIVTVVFLPQR